ncbi:MAG: hypothetical protein RLZZ628_2942 [Bacteroidota bacterium]|jgi:hypothetical protein
MNFFLQLLVLQLFITNSFAQVSPVRKKALVLGNAAYHGMLAPLKYPTQDARAISTFLTHNGFEVTLDTNLNGTAMKMKLQDFIATLSKGDVSLFFFAGHGEERSYANYLCPIASDLDSRPIGLGESYLTQLESKKCLLNIVLLNACRVDNKTMSNPSIGVPDFNNRNSSTVLSFATAPSTYAYDLMSDRLSDLSVYTESFLNIAQQGYSLNELFPRLVDSVLSKTHNSQHPWVHHSMDSKQANFKFLLPPAFAMKQVPQKTFAVGQHEVTQAEWNEIMSDNPAANPCHNCPIENVSFLEIQSFIEKLNAKTGKKYRLCSETEWEYAARGGKLTPIYRYSGSDDLNSVGWYLDNAAGKTHPVEEKRPNELGIYDMSGNVWEWCVDAAGKPILRGGSLGQEKDCRLQNRFEQASSVKSRYYGFRLCQDL